MVVNSITVCGSFVGNLRDKAMAFAADGKVKVDIKLPPLSAVNAVSGAAKGEVPAR